MYPPSAALHTSPLPSAGYTLDTAWHAERERLDSLTSLYDSGTLEICERLGLAVGWNCLEGGAGTGTLASAMVDRSAPSGRAAGC
jgi:hypothetical protein